MTVPDGGGRRRELVRVASTGDACPVVGRLTLLARRRSRGLMDDAAGGSALAALGVGAGAPRERGRGSGGAAGTGSI